jgi:uncharacterized lipoprotein YddW (UPF0748 family)
MLPERGVRSQHRRGIMPRPPARPASCMNRRTLLAAAAASIAGLRVRPVSAQDPDAPPPLLREFRGAWIATVDAIDWPSRPGVPTATARGELDAIVARAVELKLNALVFQVRPAGDAMYASKLEPWSEWLTGAQGRAPEPRWDPLQHLLDRAHAAGVQVHAWFNPFRARHRAATSAEADEHVLRRLPSACVRYGEYAWMDPGDPRAADWSLRVIRDVVERYDVDGVHIDDYFYPYPERGRPFPDDRSFAAYRDSGGRLARPDWRRACIDEFVRRLYAEVHAAKPWVLVGISPFGIARPGLPRGIEAGVDQFADLHADVQRWLREQWLDYLAPQLYWPIDQDKQSFAVLLPWWIARANGRHVWPGLSAVRALARERGWRADELRQQIDAIRDAGGAPGHVLYSFKALRGDAAHVAGMLRTRVYGQPVLAPASPWLPGDAPAVPEVRLDAGEGAPRVAWRAAAATRFVVVQVRDDRAWRTHAIVGADLGACTLPPGANAVAVTAVGRTGLASAARFAAR